MANLSTTYSPRHDGTPGAEISALESIYELAIQRFDEKEDRRGSHPDGRDAKKGSPKHEVFAPTPSIQE